MSNSQTAPGTKTRQQTAKELAGFIDRFEPSIANLVRSARSAIRKRWPTANELVYDNYNFLAIGYSATERTSDVIVSLAVYARGVNLYFMYGRNLPDPEGVLEGAGKQGAFVRLTNIGVLDRPSVKDLLREATEIAKCPLPEVGGGRTIIKSVSAKQRPRRPAGTVKASSRPRRK
jgi:hypothetical protein